MKTVMKKMFSLLLVAVLLVSAVPTAFADATPTCDRHPNAEISRRESSDVAATCTTPGQEAWRCFTPADPENNVDEYGHVIRVEVPALGHSYTSAVTTQPTCTAAGVKTYTCANSGSCTYTEPVPANGHSYNDNGICTACGICEDCNLTTCICCDKCDGTTTNHDANCPTQLCSKGCGSASHGDTACCSECGGFGHQKSACSRLYETCCNVAKGSAHRADCVTFCTRAYNCTNANHYSDCQWELCDVEGCTVKEAVTHTEHTGVRCNANNQCTFWKGHDGKHSYQCNKTAGCEYTINHSGLCSDEHEYEAGDSDLEIWVNLHTANVETKTRLLVTYKDLSENTLIHEFISDRRDEIDDMLINYYGKDYNWSGHIYDGTNTNKAVKTTTELGEGASVYINAYTYQDLVYIYVHDSRSYSNIRVILFEGKQIGDTISRSEVVDVVNDYYNLSSLKMYDESGWKKVVSGKNVEAATDLKVTAEPYHIDVLISGTAKHGSGYTADSSNPKTGDMIMAPAMVLGASATCLAVLFYLNKKRAV